MEDRRIKLIVFDLWNTLAYKDLKNNSLRVMLRKTETKMPHEKFVKIFERAIQTKKWKSEYKAYKVLAECMGIESTKENVNLLISLRDEAESKTKLYSYVKPLLGKLRKQKYKIGLLSNTSVFSIKSIRKTGLFTYIDYPLFSFDYGDIKPSLKGFKRILKIAKCRPSQAVMVGDKMKEDVLPPRKIGMGSIHFRNSKQLEKDLKKFGVSIG